MPSGASNSTWTCRRRRPYSSKHHRVPPRSSSCFRNPCIVFLCSFLVLASLRFRVRPKRAAQWIHKHSRLRSGKKDETLLVPTPVVVAQGTGSSSNKMLDFRLQEEGHLPSGAAFQRYQAVFRYNGETLKAASVQEWTQAMLATDSSASFQSFLDILQEKNQYSAFFFETRPVTASNMGSKSFEFVLVDAPALYKFASKQPDVQAFQEHFHCKGSAACVFKSLNGDATLIAPKPPIGAANLATFSHLADFCRTAKPNIVAETWKLAIQTYVEQIERQSNRNLWFSTSGMGIAWLHFRVDQRPKYYTYANFRAEK